MPGPVGVRSFAVLELALGASRNAQVQLDSSNVDFRRLQDPPTRFLKLAARISRKMATVERGLDELQPLTLS